MIKLIILLTLSLTLAVSAEYINLGKFKYDDSIFIEKDISLLSEKFLGTKYVANTLKANDINTSQENLVINLEALDCFTFIDTIHALKTSQKMSEFKVSLLNTRYKNAIVSYATRNHFFSDWIKSNNMSDITCNLGKCETVIKYLNKNQKYLKKIPTVKREISYIKPSNINLSLLKNGDYVGIYTNKTGLDVTHTGIIIKKDNKIFIRHASSLEKKIIDSELLEYTQNKPGVIIYRAP